MKKNSLFSLLMVVMVVAVAAAASSSPFMQGRAPSMRASMRSSSRNFDNNNNFLPKPFKIHASFSSCALPTFGINVKDFGVVGDGVTDDTAAFQKALDAAAAESGNTVFVPPAMYRFDGSLVVRNGTSIQGGGGAVISHPIGQESFPLIGTIFAVYGGRNDESSSPFLTLTDDCGVRGITFFYPDQKGDQEPVPYPWTIAMTGINTAVSDVELLNSYLGISAVGAARHFISRVQGQPVKIGIYVDKTFDIGRIEDVHFNPWFSPNPLFMKTQLTIGRSFVFARSDWEYVFNTFSFGYNIGYHFIASQDGACNGNFLGIGADLATNRSVLVDAADTFGILITNGEFTAFTGGWIEGNFDSTQVEISDSNEGSVRFVNSAFWGPSERIADIRGKGNTGFDSCIFSFWGGQFGNETNYAINAVGKGSLIVNACEFQHDLEQVFIGKSMSKAVVTSNLLKGKQRVYVEGIRPTGMQIANNA